MRIDCVSPIRPLCGIYKSAPRWRKSANDGSKTSCALPHRSRGQVSVGFHGIKSKKSTSAWPFVWETIASGTPAIYWTCRKRWDSPDEVASEGCGWTHPFDLLLSRILTVCAHTRDRSLETPVCPMCTILQSSESLCACYRPLLPKLWWREGLQPREGSTVRAKILPKKHKTFYFPASSELFLAR